ncbi:MAG: hypothetical protein ACOVRB_11795, partial [Akkermansiaceae bacterium]
IIEELRRRTRVVGAFPDGQSALMLCCARLRSIEAKGVIDLEKLRETDILPAETHFSKPREIEQTKPTQTTKSKSAWHHGLKLYLQKLGILPALDSSVWWKIRFFVRRDVSESALYGLKN